MEYYNDEISKRSEVELVWYPRQSENDAEEWAAEEKFPWPVIRERAFDKVEAVTKHYQNSVPGYFLVDANGELLATGLSASKRHIEGLSKG